MEIDRLSRLEPMLQYLNDLLRLFFGQVDSTRHRYSRDARLARLLLEERRPFLRLLRIPN